MGTVESRIEEMEAENKRLRAALDKIVHEWWRTDADCIYAHFCFDTAAAVVGEQKPELGEYD